MADDNRMGRSTNVRFWPLAACHFGDYPAIWMTAIGKSGH